MKNQKTYRPERQGRGVALSCIPLALLIAVVGTAIMEVAVIVSVWLGIALLLTTLIFNPFHLLDKLMDGKTRGLWAAGIALIAAGVLVPIIPIKASCVCGALGLLLLVIGWLIRRPMQAPTVLIQSEATDATLRTITHKLSTRATESWSEVGYGQAAAVFRQYQRCEVSEEVIIGPARTGYILGFETAKLREDRLMNKINKLQSALTEAKSLLQITESNLGRAQDKLSERHTTWVDNQNLQYELDAANETIASLQCELAKALDEKEQAQALTEPAPAALPEGPDNIIPIGLSRDDAIRQAVAQGASYKEVADQFGISKTRAHQICKLG